MKGLSLILLLWVNLGWAGISATGSCDSTAGGTSCTFNLTNTGDLKIVIASVSTVTTAPSLPAGWTSILTVSTASGGVTGSARVGCNISSSSSDTGTGTWTNATRVTGVSYSGTVGATTANCNTTGIGGTASNSAKTSTSENYPTITMTNGTGTSWVAGLAGAASASSNCPPTGMSGRAGSQFAENLFNDTNGGVSSWSSTSCTVTSET